MESNKETRASKLNLRNALTPTPDKDPDKSLRRNGGRQRQTVSFENTES